MKKSFKSVLALMICFIVLFSAGACGGKSSDKKLGYEVDKSKMFGICAIPNMGYSSSVDPGVTTEVITTLGNAMNMKSIRVWMHVPYVLERAAKSNEIKFKPKAVADFHEYIKELTDAGFTNIVVMSHFYLFPVEMLRPSSSFVVPEYDTYEYILFMEMYRECFRMLSEEFPEITHWEPNNETNHEKGASVVRQGYLSSNTVAENAQYLYSQEELALITADMCYYANLGIKESNPENLLVMPGLVFSTTRATEVFLEYMYDHIKSGKLPTSFDEDYEETGIMNRKIKADKNSDNYFNVLNWHPYANTAPTQTWLEANVAIYNVAVANGDKGKKIHITEFGWYDSFNETRKESIGEWYPQAFDMLIEALPTIESIFVFRMFNWISTGSGVADMEKTFGIFTSPSESTGITPKPAALSLFKYFNGEDADDSVLYQYAK